MPVTCGVDEDQKEALKALLGKRNLITNESDETADQLDPLAFANFPRKEIKVRDEDQEREKRKEILRKIKRRREKKGM